MSKRKEIRVLSMLALCAVLICSFSLTAFAYADDTEQNLPVTEATQPEDMPETEPPAETLPEGEPIDDEGNASTRDLLYIFDKFIIVDDQVRCKSIGLVFRL